MMVVLDKHGWPVERFSGRPITNAIRYLLHGRKVVSLSAWRMSETKRLQGGDGAGMQKAPEVSPGG
jgi:hypothetical protein